MIVNILCSIGFLLVMAGIAYLTGRALIRSSRNLPRPCYRCAAIATTDYMGLHYCIMCRVVVVQMIQAVRHDPPYGFPGASGYIDFPEPSEAPVDGKKES